MKLFNRRTILLICLAALILSDCASKKQPHTTDAHPLLLTVPIVPVPLVASKQIIEPYEITQIEPVPAIQNIQPVALKEIWAYVLSGDEASLNRAWPVSDVALFGAGISSTGKLRGVPDRNAFKNYKGRVHMVIAELSNYALLHFCLAPDFPIRTKLIEQIVAAAQQFDGVNIDFESILTEDTENFLSFLKAVKKGIGNKILSVALPARIKKINEAYDYEKVSAIADRVIIMAYDEHWSGSKPGSVASLSWCSNVARYALETIGAKKLVMGIPFYGRAWSEINPSRAYRYPTVQKLMQDKGVASINIIDGSNYFEYTETVKVYVYYEDYRSVHRRADMYAGMGIHQISFWRVGQEDTEIWKHLSLSASPK